MEARFYRIAGLCFRVQGQSCWFSERDGLLSKFRVPEDKWDVDCVLDVVENLSQPEGEFSVHDGDNRIFLLEDRIIRYVGAAADSLSSAYIRIERKDRHHAVQIKRKAIPHGLTSNAIMRCLEVVHHMTQTGGFLLHASWIRIDGKAVLFTGPSGVGKSTQAALWVQHRNATLVNGDRAAVFPLEDQVQVRGVPYCGSSGVTENLTMPLAAVVCLSQAPETTITRLTGARAFHRLWQECCINVWNPGDLEQASESVSAVISRVPIFHLSCTPDLSAVLALEKEGVV